MKRSTWAVALGAALAMVAAQAVMAEATPNSQQTKMTTCNADAKTKGLKGDERKTFMKNCLGKAEPAAKGNSQQEKMKSCNADAKAKALKGDARKSYMSSCLKGDK